jgi:hypothetical protein
MILDEEQDEWQSLENTPFDSERIVSINCDTRDFHCGWTLDSNKENIDDLRTISKPEYRSRFFMTIEEVKEILYDLRERTGGIEPKWRYLSFKEGNNTLGGSWQFKYLRFYKSEFGWYCRPRSESKVIRKEWLKLPIDEEYLSAH